MKRSMIAITALGLSMGLLAACHDEPTLEPVSSTDHATEAVEPTAPTAAAPAPAPEPAPAPAPAPVAAAAPAPAPAPVPAPEPKPIPSPVVHEKPVAKPNLAPPLDTSKARTYTVKKGDTLYGIAREFYGSASKYKDIIRANPGIDPNVIKVGQKLNIP